MNCTSVVIVDLGPASDARLHQVTHTIEWDDLLQFFYQFRSFRSWANYTHFSTEHIEQLWYFIQPRFAQKTTDPSDAGVSFGCPARFAIFFSIHIHGTEFIHGEYFAPTSTAFLTIKHRTRRL